MGKPYSVERAITRGRRLNPLLPQKKHPKLRMLGVLSCCLNLGSWPGGGASGDGCHPVGLSSFKYKTRSTVATRFTR
jgi:hypothetical protein